MLISINMAQKLEGYNKELLLLDNINELLLQDLDEESLFKDICACLTAYGGYSLAWIGYKPEQYFADRTVDYHQNHRTSLQDSILSSGPVAQVILTANMVVTNDVEAEQTFAPWLKNAVDFKIKSLIALAFIRR